MRPYCPRRLWERMGQSVTSRPCRDEQNIFRFRFGDIRRDYAIQNLAVRPQPDGMVQGPCAGHLHASSVARRDPGCHEFPLRRSSYHRHAARRSCALSPPLASRAEGRQEGHLHRRVEGLAGGGIPRRVSGCLSGPRFRGRLFPGCFGRLLSRLLPVLTVQVLPNKARDQRRLFEAVTRAICVEPFGLIFRKQDVDARKLRHGAISHHAEARRLRLPIQAPRA